MTEAEYYQAKSVLDSPNDYDGRMVTDARNYVRGYEDAQSQLKAKMPSDEYVKKLEFMIDNGLGWNDLKNDI